MLPKDPAILLSVVNTKLRDFYSSLDALCDDLQIEKSELEATIAKFDYHYNQEKNQFI